MISSEKLEKYKNMPRVGGTSQWTCLQTTLMLSAGVDGARAALWVRDVT